MSTHEAETPKGLAPSSALRAQMREDGFIPIMSWYKPGGVTPPPGCPAPAESARTDDPKSAAQRQREQVQRDADAGKARCTVKTADDEESRQLLALVAAAMLNGRNSDTDAYHRALHIAVGNPQAALLGSRALVLRGMRRRVVFKLIGA